MKDAAFAGQIPVILAAKIRMMKYVSGLEKGEKIMPAISAELKELLKKTELYIFPEDFVVVYLPHNVKTISGEWFRQATTRFALVIREPKLVTMVIPRRKWLRMQNIFEKYETNGSWKVISFKIKNKPVLNSYLAAVESALKDSKIRIMPVSTLRSCHILVPKLDLPRAVRLLRDFLENNKKKNSVKVRK